MCGIVAYFGGAGNNLTRILTAMSAIVYRAPDSTGVGFLGDDVNPLQVRKSLGSVASLIPVLLDDPAYPNPTADLLSVFTPDSGGASAQDLQRRLLDFEGFPLDIFDALVHGKQLYPSFDDLVELDSAIARSIAPGFPGRTTLSDDLYIRSRNDLRKVIQHLIVTYDLAPLIIQILIRRSLAKTLQQMQTEGNLEIEPTDVLDAFDRLFDQSISGEKRPRPQRLDYNRFPKNPNAQKYLWRYLIETPIKIPADFDRDGVRCVFRLLDGALLSRLPHNSWLEESLNVMLEKLWQKSGRIGAIDWKTLYKAEKAVNVYGWAAGSALTYLKQKQYIPELQADTSQRELSTVAVNNHSGQTDPLCLRYFSSPILSQGRWAIQAPVTLQNAHPFYDARKQRLIVLNGQFDANVESKLKDFIQHFGAASLRSENSSEYLALLWGYYFDQLSEDKRRYETIKSHVEAGLGKFNIGSQAIDYQIYHRVQAKSRADLDEMAFLEAVRHLIQEGGQNAAVGISLESPRRIYVASHNRPIFVVRRLENDDFMVVSDINAAMGLFPQALIHRKTSQLTKLREQRHKALDELKASRAKKETIQACEVKYRRKEEKLIEAFRVAIYPFDGEEIFARIETKFEENNLRRGVSITDFDGNPLPEIESFLTILSPPAIRNDIYKSYFETHLHEIPERLTEILQSYVPEDDSCPDFQIREALFSRRFGRKWAGLKRIILVGMGSAYHMATIARSYFKKLLPEMEVMVLMPVEVDDPTKFIVPETDLVVLLSWSATTANMVAFAKSLEADKPVMVAITEKGFADMALIARRSGGVIPILSGEEVTITGIKSTQCMLFCIFLFAIWLAFKKGRIKAALSCLKRLQRVPETVLQVLSDETLEKFSKNLASQSAKSYAAVVLDALESTGSAREIASKLEETSWTAIGKPLDYRNLYTKVLKPDLNKNLVLVNATHKARFNDGLDAMKVLHEQGIPFAAVSYPNRSLAQIEHYSQGNFVLLPKVEDVLQPFVDLAFYYRFAFHYGLAHGRNAEDFPRNRVKSVTATRSLPRLIVSAAAELHLMEQRDSTATSADSVSLSLAEESAWELDSNIAWEKRYYREMRRLAKGLQGKDPISTFLKLPAKNSAHLTEAFLNAISKEGEIIFIALDRRSDATARTLVANWRRILGCPMRVTNADFAPIAFSDNSIFIFLAAEKPDEEMLLKRVRKYSLPQVWVGPQLSKEPALFFNHSAGYYILKKEFGLSQADALYAGVSLLIENSWKKYQPSKATILRNHLRGSGSVIHSLLNDASIKNILMQAMTANRIYKSAFFLGPPIGTGTIWVDRFSQIKGPIMEFHSFGESVHGPIVTVDSSVEDKYIKLEDRKQMVLTYGKNNVLQWEERCLGGTKIDNFLSQPLDDQSTGINTPFFAEGSWYLPVLRNDYDPANDNLIIIDATSERYFAQAIDELASYACRYARMIVISQEAFRNDLTKKVLHTYPISHLIEVPAMKGNNSERIPISDFILPFSMNLLGVAMAAANC